MSWMNGPTRSGGARIPSQDGLRWPFLAFILTTALKGASARRAGAIEWCSAARCGGSALAQQSSGAGAVHGADVGRAEIDGRVAQAGDGPGGEHGQAEGRGD